MKLKLNLKAARHQAGMTQMEAGEILGVGQYTISKWETGEIKPAIEMRRVIAREYGLQMEQIDWSDHHDD